MQYCKVEGNGISITLPESIERLEETILASALKHGAFGDGRGTSIDEEKGNYRHITVAFPEEADKKSVQDFAEKVDSAIKALVEMDVDLK